MRRLPFLKTLIVVASFALVALVYAWPDALGGAHRRVAAGEAAWLALGVLALGLAAKLTIPAGLVALKAPLLPALAAPYLLRRAWRRALARPQPAKPPSGPRPRPSAPYALPARVATALQAAARARR